MGCNSHAVSYSNLLKLHGHNGPHGLALSHHGLGLGIAQHGLPLANYGNGYGHLGYEGLGHLGHNSLGYGLGYGGVHGDHHVRISNKFQ